MVLREQVLLYVESCYISPVFSCTIFTVPERLGRCCSSKMAKLQQAIHSGQFSVSGVSENQRETAADERCGCVWNSTRPPSLLVHRSHVDPGPSQRLGRGISWESNDERI